MLCHRLLSKARCGRTKEGSKPGIGGPRCRILPVRGRRVAGSTFTCSTEWRPVCRTPAYKLSDKVDFDGTVLGQGSSMRSSHVCHVCRHIWEFGSIVAIVGANASQGLGDAICHLPFPWFLVHEPQATKEPNNWRVDQPKHSNELFIRICFAYDTKISCVPRGYARLLALNPHQHGNIAHPLHPYDRAMVLFPRQPG
jgi:hypothetical protein